MDKLKKYNAAACIIPKLCNLMTMNKTAADNTGDWEGALSCSDEVLSSEFSDCVKTCLLVFPWLARSATFLCLLEYCVNVNSLWRSAVEEPSILVFVRKTLLYFLVRIEYRLLSPRRSGRVSGPLVVVP